MRVPFVRTIVALLALAIATGCVDTTPTLVPVYEQFSCREIADEFTLQNSHIRRITDIRIITEDQDELLCRGRADVELATDYDVVIYARRLGSGRITYGVDVEE